MDVEKIIRSQLRSQILYKGRQEISQFNRNPMKAIKELKHEKTGFYFQPIKYVHGCQPRPKSASTGWIDTWRTSVKTWKFRTHRHLQKNTNELLSKLRGILSRGKFEYIKYWVHSQRILIPQLLIKDHKDPNEDGTYPTHLIVPATNYTQCYAKNTYNASKAIFDANNVQYEKHTIVQSTHLKRNLEQLNLKAG